MISERAPHPSTPSQVSAPSGAANVLQGIAPLLRPNLIDPQVRANPYPLYARLRREAPVCQIDPHGMWAVSRYDDIMTVLKNPQVFSSSMLRATAEPPWLGRNNPIADSIIVMDQPQHGRLRTLIGRAFGANTLSRMEPFVRGTIDRLIDKMMEKRQVEFVSDFALPLPAAVIGELLGLDPELRVHFKRWSDDTAALPAILPDDLVRQAEVRNSVNEMERYLEEVLERRRREPGDDMVSDLLRAQVDGEKLSHREIMGFLFVLLLASMETTIYLVSHAVTLLAEKPDVMARVRGNLSLIPRFIEEVLRYEPPLHGTLRVTTTEAEVGGVRLPAGSMVLPLWASGLRDEAHFPDGERFDLDRTTNSNLAFGHGIHYCLGALLARMETRMTLEALLKRCSAIVRPAEPIQWCHSLTFRGPVTLPLELIPA